MSKVITLQELRAKLDAGEELVLVEALGPQYYSRPGTCPVRSTSPTPRSTRWRLRCCRIATRRSSSTAPTARAPNSGIAAARLTALGYTDVRDYHEGKAEWREAGLPLEAGPAPVRA